MCTSLQMQCCEQRPYLRKDPPPACKVALAQPVADSDYYTGQSVVHAVRHKVAKKAIGLQTPGEVRSGRGAGKRAQGLGANGAGGTANTCPSS